MLRQVFVLQKYTAQNNVLYFRWSTEPKKIYNPGQKYLEWSKETQQDWTGLEDFDINFYVFLTAIAKLKFLEGRLEH